MPHEEDYPLLEKPSAAETPAREKTSVRLLKALDADIQFIADVWNEFDKEKLERAKAEAKARGEKLKLKPGKKWKKSSVMELFIERGRDRWARTAGGIPTNDADRAVYLRESKKHFAEITAKAASERAALAKKSSK